MVEDDVEVEIRESNWLNPSLFCRGAWTLELFPGTRALNVIRHSTKKVLPRARWTPHTYDVVGAAFCFVQKVNPSEHATTDIPLELL